MPLTRGNNSKINNIFTCIVIGLIPLRPVITIDIYNLFIVTYIAYNFFTTIMRGKVKTFPLLIGFVLFLIYSVFSIFYSHSLTGTGYVLRRMIPLYAFGFFLSQSIIYNNTSTENRIETVHKIILSYVTTTVLTSIYLFLFELPLLGIWGKIGRFHYAEEGLTTYSYHLIVSSTFLIYLILCHIKKYNKMQQLLLISSLMIILVASLLTSIRKTIFAPVFFIGSILFFRNRRNFTKLISGTLITLALAIGIYFFIINNSFLYNIIGVRLESLVTIILYNEQVNSDFVDASSIERALLRNNAWELFLQFPIFGYGIDAFKFYTSNHGTRAVYAHNNFLELLASTGLVGFTIYYSAIWITLKQTIDLFSHTKNEVYLFPISFILMQVILDYGTVSYYSFVFIPLYFIIGTFTVTKEKR